MKIQIKKALSLVLAISMLMVSLGIFSNAALSDNSAMRSAVSRAEASVSSFAKPSASDYSQEDADDGKYYVKIAMYATGTIYTNDESSVYLEYRDENGSGTKSSTSWNGALTENYWRTDGSRGLEVTGVINGFPTHASCGTNLSGRSILSRNNQYIFLCLYVYDLTKNNGSGGWVQIGTGKGLGGSNGYFNPSVEPNEYEGNYNTTYKGTYPVLKSGSLRGINDIVINDEVIERLDVTALAQDQYGVAISAIPSYQVNMQLSTTGIDYIDNGAGVLIFRANYMAKTQNVTITANFTLAGENHSYSKTFSITNNTSAAYDTYFKYYVTNTADLDNPILNQVEGAPVFPNEQVTVPEDLDPVPIYYTRTNHYTGATFGTLGTITETTIYEAYGYVEEPHDFQKVEVKSPANGTNGTMHLKCSVCGYEVSARYNSTTGKIEPNTASSSVTNVTVPSVKINDYNSSEYNYDYSRRGASLRVSEVSEGYQQMRFTASAELPANAEVVDFGYLYTQTKYLLEGAEPVKNTAYNPDAFKEGAEKIFKFSCYKEGNGRFTVHDGNIYTFNLLVNIAKKNWQAHNAARAYMTYNYGGYEFTVYDDTYSSRTVKCIAERIAAASGESQYNKNYVNSKILSNYTSDLKMLHQSGRNIVDSSGNIVQLTGVNLGGWLLQEAWMCPINKGDSDKWGQWDTYHKLVDRFGEDKAIELLDIYRINWITAADLDYMKNLGMNCVRVPFWYGNLLSSDNSLEWRTDETGAKDFSYLDWIIDQCGQRNMYVLLDLHGAIGFQSTNHSGGKCDSMKLFETTANSLTGTITGGSTNATYANLNANFWKEIAKRYKDNPVVAGYDLVNEPLNNDGVKFGTNARRTIYSEYYDIVYDAIRTVDTNHLCVMEGIWEMSDLPDITQYGWSNVAYSCHNYNYNTSEIDTKISSYQSATSSASTRVPMIVGEFNPSSILDYVCEHYNNAFQYTSTKSNGGFSWFTWTYKGAKTGLSDWFMCASASAPIVNIESDSFATIYSKWGARIRTDGGIISWNYNETMNNGLSNYYKAIPGVN